MTDMQSNLPAGTPKVQKARPVGLPETIRILLEENENIPRNGLFIGHNGRSYILKPGMAVNVPRGLLDVLDNAVESTAVRDPNSQQVIGYRDKLRYSYRTLPPEAVVDDE